MNKYIIGIQQAQQHTSTVADELRKIQEYWNPQSPNCQFKVCFLFLFFFFLPFNLIWIKILEIIWLNI